MGLPFLKRSGSSLSPELKTALETAEKQHREVLQEIKKQHQGAVEARPVDMGPFEKVIVFDNGLGGVTWIAALPRRVLMEHVDIVARRLQQMNRTRNMLVFGFLGMLFGAPLGVIFGFTAVLTGLTLFSWTATLLLFFMAFMVLGMAPGAALGWYRKGHPCWFVMRDGEEVAAVEYETFDSKRFTGHVNVTKDDKGQVQVHVPPGVKAQSATFMFHACRSSDWRGLFKGGTSSQAKLQTVGVIVIAVCSLIIMFLVGWTSLGGGGSTAETPSAPTATEGGMLPHG